MPQPPTFLRFTTRGLLYVMLGLSVALAIAFSLLPPLLGITRGQMAMMVGWYSLGFLLCFGALGLRQYRLATRASRPLLRLPLFVQTRGRYAPRIITPILTLVLSWIGYSRVVRDNGQFMTSLVLMEAGFFGALAFFSLFCRRVTECLTLYEDGVVHGMGTLIPWDMVQTRNKQTIDCTEPSIEFHFAFRWHRPELTPADLEAVEAILIKHKPGYADLANV